MLSAITIVVASQIALALLLFGTTYLERPRPAGHGRLAGWLRRRRGELATLRRNQELLSGLGRVSSRSAGPAGAVHLD